MMLMQNVRDQDPPVNVQTKEIAPLQWDTRSDACGNCLHIDGTGEMITRYQNVFLNQHKCNNSFASISSSKR